MCLEKCTVISCVNHVARRDHNILRVDLIEAVKVFHVSSDICVVNTVVNVALLEESNQFTTFGVDIVMTSCSDVFYERTRFSANINLHYINSTVTHIRNREVDHTISSEKRDRSGRTISLHRIPLYIIACEIYDSKCSTHLILPPLHVLQPVRYFHCLHCRQPHSFRSLRCPRQGRVLRLHLLLLPHPASVHCQ